MIDQPLDLAPALRANQQVFLVSCLRRQFAFLVDVLNVQADVLLAGLEQLGQFRLRQPERFLVQPHVDLDAAIFGLIDQELAFAGYGGV